MKVLNHKGNYGDKIYNNQTVSEITSKKNTIHDWMDAECVELCDALNLQEKPSLVPLGTDSYLNSSNKTGLIDLQNLFGKIF